MRSNLAIQSLWSLVFAWFLGVALTFNGVIAFPHLQPISLVMLVLGVALWLWRHHQAAWQWHRSPLDIAWCLWGGAILLSILSHGETWRRSVEGLWYVLLYGLVFYLWADCLLNGLRRNVLVNAFLVYGSLVVLIGLVQGVYGLLTGQGLVRPVSFLGNANALGSVLIGVYLLALSRIIWARRPAPVWVLLTLASGALLLATFSRGAWLGALAGTAVLFGGWLYQRGMLTRTGWQKATPRQRRWVRVIAGVGVLGGLVLALVTLASLGIGGRGADYRLPIWQSALTQFAENPLTGSGLFTFGRGLARDYPTPPFQPHSHPHNLPLLILAELGLVGGVALSASVVWILKAWARNLRFVAQSQASLALPEQAAFYGALAASVGFGVHHLFDTPMMMPAVALCGLLALSLSVLPYEAVPMQAVWRKRGHPLGMAALSVGLALSGGWVSQQYQRYYAIMSQGLAPAQAAQALIPVVQVEPQQSVYILQQAYLYGLAAAQGDAQALQAALTGYARYTQLEPYHAQAWSNLAALACQAGDRELAQSAIEHALRLSPAWDSFERQARVIAGEVLAPFQPIEDSRWLSYARAQFLRDILPKEYLPQVGWGTPCADFR